MEKFPSMKIRILLRILQKEPLNYFLVRQTGSHRLFRSNNYPDLTISYHDSVEVSGSYIRDLLIKKVQLTSFEAREILK